MKISIKKILYVFSAGAVMNFRFWNINIPDILKYSIMAFWTLYFFMNCLVSDKRTETKRAIVINFKLMFIPILLMAAYAVLVWVFFQKGVIFRNYTRLISTCLYLFLGWGFASSGYYIFKDKVIDYLFWGGAISYGIGSVVCLIVTYGFGGLMLYMRALLFGEDNVANYMMEVHDLTFAMGIFFLFYAFCDKRKDRKKKIILSALIIFLGLKRIEILAIAIAVIVYYLLLKWGKTIKFRAIMLTIIYSFLGLGYVYLVDSGLLNALVTYFSLNTMGRLEYYNYAKQYFSFTPWFIGNGFTYFTRLWGELSFSGYRINGTIVAASIHSDLLVLYIENGFIFTLGWIIYSFNIKLSSLRKHFNNDVGECYLLLTVYMFVLYLTDNTFRYSGTQIAYYVAPLVMCYFCQKSIKASKAVVQK